jgi:hypothetical protein
MNMNTNMIMNMNMDLGINMDMGTNMDMDMRCTGTCVSVYTVMHMYMSM